MRCFGHTWASLIARHASFTLRENVRLAFPM